MVPSKSNRAALKSLRTLLLRHSMDCISYLHTYFIKALLVLCLAVTLRSYRHCSSWNTQQTAPDLWGLAVPVVPSFVIVMDATSCQRMLVLRRSPEASATTIPALVLSPAPQCQSALRPAGQEHAPPEFRRTPTARFRRTLRTRA